METKQLLRDFVLKELRRRSGGKPVELNDGESLLLSAKTDSLFFVDLILFLETKFSLNFDPSNVSREDLDSIDKMAAFIESKK